MNLSQACLSSWQINLTELFASNLQEHTTEEHLSRLESFITTYFLFDRIFVADEYRDSAFLASLDENKEIFTPDPRIPGLYRQDSTGERFISVSPALLFKNQRHFRSKSGAWEKQHMALDLTREQRDELVAYNKKTGRSKSAPFYKFVLAEYQTLFDLSVLNDACSVPFGSMSQVYLPDIAELPRFLAFLKRLVKNARLPSSDHHEFSGLFSFEIATGGVEARINIPRFFTAVLEHVTSAGLTAVLPLLRRTYRPMRDAFRQVLDAFMRYPGRDLVTTDMTGKELKEWNAYIASDFGTFNGALLLKSDVLALELHAGLDESQLHGSFGNLVKAASPLLRLIPPHSFMSYSRKAGTLSSLGVEDVLPFERRLFRIGKGYRNMRSVLHSGLGCVLSFPLSVLSQLTQEQLNEPAVRAACEQRPPHLYMVCTRPRITLNPVTRPRPEGIETEFQFHHGTHVECERIGLSDVKSVMVDGNSGEQVLTQDLNGERKVWSASLLYQSVAMAVIPTAFPPSMESKTLTEQHRNLLRHLDLEVIYIGQSRGKEFDRTAVDRLGHHEKWQLFDHYCKEENPHLETWILLISQGPVSQFNMALPNRPAQDGDAAELMRRTQTPPPIDHADRLNFIEAALISYFKPRFNDKFKTSSFPSQRHESYDRFFMTPVDAAAFELETRSTIGCRLYSNSAEPRFLHLKSWQFNSDFDMQLLRPE